MKVLAQKKYQDHIPCSFAIAVVLVHQLLFLKVKMLLINWLKQFLKSMNTVKKVMKKTFQQKFDHDWKRRRKVSIK